MAVSRFGQVRNCKEVRDAKTTAQPLGGDVSTPRRFSTTALVGAMATSSAMMSSVCVSVPVYAAEYNEVLPNSVQAGVQSTGQQSQESSEAGENQQSQMQLESALDALGVTDNIEISNDADGSTINGDEQAQSVSAQVQAIEAQQNNYQMVTPEQIERELDSVSTQMQREAEFDEPVATIDGNSQLIGLDNELDASVLPSPTNLETLGQADVSQTQAEQAEPTQATSETNESQSSVNMSAQNEQAQQADTGEQAQEDAQNEAQVAAAIDDSTADGAEIEDDALDVMSPENSEDINPDDYLPEYQEDDGIEVAQDEPPPAPEEPKISWYKRLYNQYFQDGYITLPKVETTVYLGDGIADTQTDPENWVEADDDEQPYKNIKAALDEVSIESVVDFRAAGPRLREEALDAAKAVGYYDVSLRIEQPSQESIDVIIESVGDPVIVDNRIIDVRGGGETEEDFITLEETLAPNEGDVLNHGVYESSKASIEKTSGDHGFFDSAWLNNSVEVILPDNIADVSLVYDTGEQYDFDEVVFFTIDRENWVLTSDPDKLPVRKELLEQLVTFESGDPFYRPSVTKLSNDLSATRFFNAVNVEVITPPTLGDDSDLTFSNDADEPNEDGTESVSTEAADTSLEASAGVTVTNGADDEQVAQEVIEDSTGMSDDETLQAQNDSDGTEENTLSEDDEEIQPIEFTVDEQTKDKLAAIKEKANRLSRMPNDRILDEAPQESENLLGKISDSVSEAVSSVLPDEDKDIPRLPPGTAPPVLAGKKTPQEVQESKKVPLYVFVMADEPRDAEVGIGYGTDSGMRAKLKVDNNLINRDGYQAGFAVDASRISKNATVYASRPWKHPLNDKLDASLSYEEEVIDQGEGNFDLTTDTVKASIARNIYKEDGWNRSYSLRYRLDKLETGVDDAELEDLPVRFTSSNPTQEAVLFGYGMSKTDIDSLTSPTQGYRQYYSIEAGSDSLQTDTNMAIARAGVSGMYSFGENDVHQVIGRFDGGYLWADDFYDVPYKLRFFAGGDQSIRGYDYESLSPLANGYLTGGQILAVGSAEYNYEFKPGLRGAVFTDVGNAYDEDFKAPTKVGVGFGIRWASPVGTVRVDLAAGVSEENIPIRLHFFIGSPL